MKPAFLAGFCYFWKDKSFLILDLFISEYLDQILPWKELRETFSEKLQTGNLCFFIKLKSNKNHAPQIRNVIQSSRIFIWILGPIPEKKSALINDWKILHIGKKQSKERRWQTCLVCCKVRWESGWSHYPRNILQFLPLENNTSKKMRSPDRAKFKKRRNLFVNLEKLRSTA